METTTVVVIGAGQAGLAASACLRARGIDHVVLDRDRVASAWRTQRWDSLRLLTPNWLTRLPGGSYGGPEPDGFMTAAEVATFFDGYAVACEAPVRAGATVRTVARDDAGFVVASDGGVLRCRAVIVATGACSIARVPGLAGALPVRVRQLSPLEYRRPGDVDDGRVLVVGASASGVQIADELVRSGRSVTLAVGAHTRVPRTYRGRDIHAWMDALGLLALRSDEVDDLVRARRQPSLQLVGSPERRTLDLNALVDAGVELVGRLVGVDGARAQCSGSLDAVCADADLKLGRLLDQVDAYAAAHGIDAPDGDRPSRTVVRPPRTSVPLDDVGTVVWATGLRPSHPFLPSAWLDRRDAIAHDGGVSPVPGLYVLGLPFLRTRASGFIDGVGRDATVVVDHIARRLHGSRRPIVTAVSPVA